MEAHAVGPDSSYAIHPRSVRVPLAGTALVGAVVAYGLLATATGHELGTALPPLLYRWAPHFSPFALVAVACLAAGAGLTPRLQRAALSPARFAAAALALGLGLRLALGIARTGPDGLWAIFDVPSRGAASEYLPSLGALDLGARFFLDTFAQVGTSLTVNGVGHPPGLLLSLHALHIESARPMAALTIGVGALSVPLTYVLARRVVDEGSARTATLLYAFAPSAVMHGATSADAAYASLAVVAMIALAGVGPLQRAGGAAALALASFFSWANLGVGALMALLALRRDGPRSAVVLCVTCAAGLLAFYGLLYLGTGFDPFGAIHAAESVYREGVAADRPYAYWVLGAPAAFLIAAGLPIAWLALRALEARQTMAVALFAVLGISALLGFTKGETERIYLFLVPPLCIAAATRLPAARLQPVLAALAVQALAFELLLYTVW